MADKVEIHGYEEFCEERTNCPRARELLGARDTPEYDELWKKCEEDCPNKFHPYEMHKWSRKKDSQLYHFPSPTDRSKPAAH